MISDGTRVRVSYVGMLEDGTVFDDSSAHGGPLEFTIGNNEVIRGFEEAVREMEVGEEREVTIPPEKGYGERRNELVVEIPTEQMVATGKNPHPGMVIQTPSGLYGVVTEVGHFTKVDFNHPLAGRTLKFRIRLEAVVGEGGEKAEERSGDKPEGRLEEQAGRGDDSSEREKPKAGTESGLEGMEDGGAELQGSRPEGQQGQGEEQGQVHERHGGSD